MSKLVVTADIHGSFSAWNIIKKRLSPEDTLAIAGDLFDTIYQSIDPPDFQPERIKEEFIKLNCRKFYVYGNCDDMEFLGGQSTQVGFKDNHSSIFLNHGHLRLPDLTDYDIIIEGHTHIPKLDVVMGKVFMNPGSPVLPRNGFKSYAVVEDRIIKIISLPDNKTMSEVRLDSLINEPLCTP